MQRSADPGYGLPTHHFLPGSPTFRWRSRSWRSCWLSDCRIFALSGRAPGMPWGIGKPNLRGKGEEPVVDAYAPNGTGAAW